jgi:hypothetical protein
MRRAKRQQSYFSLEEVRKISLPIQKLWDINVTSGRHVKISSKFHESGMRHVHMLSCLSRLIEFADLMKTHLGLRTKHHVGDPAVGECISPSTVPTANPLSSSPQSDVSSSPIHPYSGDLKSGLSSRKRKRDASESSPCVMTKEESSNAKEMESDNENEDSLPLKRLKAHHQTESGKSSQADQSDSSAPRRSQRLRK